MSDRDGVEDHLGQRLVEHVREEARPQRQETRPSRPHDDLCTVTDENGRVRHEFIADGPNRLWLTDITEHKTAEGKLYLCAIKDVFGNKIIRVLDRLADEVKPGRPSARERCSDAWRRRRLRGSQRPRQPISKQEVLVCSDPTPPGRIMPSGLVRRQRRDGIVLALLQKNVLDRRSWTTREQLRIAIVTWIERTYHRRRRQASLGRLTPIEFEAIMNTTVALAASARTVTYPCSSPLTAASSNGEASPPATTNSPLSTAPPSSSTPSSHGPNLCRDTP